MLEYIINASSFGSAFRQLSVSSVDLSPYSTTDDSDTRTVLTCHYDGNDEFVEGQNIKVSHSISIPDDGSDTGYAVKSFDTDHVIVACDNMEKTFRIVYDRMMDISITDFSVSDDGWWKVTLSHDNNQSISQYLGGVMQTEVSFVTRNGVLLSYTALFYYFSDFSLRYFANDIPVDLRQAFLNTIYTYSYVVTEDNPDNVYQSVDLPDNVYCTSPDYILVDGVYYKKVADGPNLSTVVFRTASVEFSEDDNYAFLVENIAAKVTIPITAMTGDDPSKEEVIRDVFVESEVKNSINSIVEMEKDIYYPYRNTNSGLMVSHQIVFNFHFRQHTGIDWLVEDDSVLWNGSGWNNVAAGNTNQYFSYSDKSDQSDLLMFLGFDNSDVRFRKNALSKSFLRLLFYDSMHSGTQNLLAYSTVFMDSGSLFMKMASNANVIDNNGNGIYTIINSDISDTPNASGVKRAAVNTEPDIDGDDNDKERYRISSRIVVDSRRVASKSSEGYCLYLWRDYSDGVIPVNIYMKAEFHNAKYGRKIPLMAPYYDNGNGFKSYEDIIDDWNGEGYGVRIYNDYSYIRFKHAYNKDLDKHVYYLDNDIYGIGGYDNDDNMVINFYEAKIRF